MKIGILGPGRLGCSLARLVEAAGHTVDLRREGVPQGDFLLLTVPDSRIAQVAAALPLSDRPVLHCSGTTPVEVLRPHCPAGSFHPLMTFPGVEVAVPDLSGVPAAIAGDEEAVVVATQLAETLLMRPIQVPGDRRLYHGAAVIAGNFATILLAEASRLLAAAGVPEEDAPSLLAPLAIQSLRNAADRGPAQSLTGPIARGDESTLAGHREAMKNAGFESLVPLYDAFVERGQALLLDEK